MPSKVIVGTAGHHHDWIVPRRVMCAFFWMGIILLFTGIILLVTSKHKGDKKHVYHAWGSIMLGLGFCLMLVCLILCLHAYCVITVSDEELSPALPKDVRGVAEEMFHNRRHVPPPSPHVMMNGKKPPRAIDSPDLVSQKPILKLDSQLSMDSVAGESASPSFVTETGSIRSPGSPNSTCSSPPSYSMAKSMKLANPPACPLKDTVVTYNPNKKKVVIDTLPTTIEIEEMSDSECSGRNVNNVGVDRDTHRFDSDNSCGERVDNLGLDRNMHRFDSDNSRGERVNNVGVNRNMHRFESDNSRGERVDNAGVDRNMHRFDSDNSRGERVHNAGVDRNMHRFDSDNSRGERVDNAGVDRNMHRFESDNSRGERVNLPEDYDEPESINIEVKAPNSTPDANTIQIREQKANTPDITLGLWHRPSDNNRYIPCEASASSSSTSSPICASPLVDSFMPATRTHSDLIKSHQAEGREHVSPPPLQIQGIRPLQPSAGLIRPSPLLPHRGLYRPMHMPTLGPIGERRYMDAPLEYRPPEEASGPMAVDRRRTNDLVYVSPEDLTSSKLSIYDNVQYACKGPIQQQHGQGSGPSEGKKPGHIHQYTF